MLVSGFFLTPDPLLRSFPLLSSDFPGSPRYVAESQGDSNLISHLPVRRCA